MPFTDSAGREWHPKINCFVLRQFEDQTGVSMSEAGKVLNGGKIKPILTLAFFSIGAEAAERNVSMTDFEKSVETLEQFEAVVESVAEAFVLFSQSGAKASRAKRDAPGPGGKSTS